MSKYNHTLSLIEKPKKTPKKHTYHIFSFSCWEIVFSKKQFICLILISEFLLGILDKPKCKPTI